MHVEDLQNVRAREKLCEFRPQLFFQQVEPWQYAHSGLEFKMNMDTGVNQARFISSIDLEKGPRAELAAAIERAMHIVDCADEDREDFHAVQGRLLSAATWGNTKQLEHLLTSCFVTETCALPALAEACALGHEACVQVLLRAGVSPSKFIPHNPAGKNCLHIAADHGQEDVARLLIQWMNSAEEMYRRCRAHNRTAFDILRENDLKGTAKRLELVVRTRLAELGYYL